MSERYEGDQEILAINIDEANETNEDPKQYPFDGGIMVFGHGWSKEAKVGGGWQLSPEAYMRATAAYQLWHEGLAPRIILTGGEPTKWATDNFGENIQANSLQMKDFLTKKFNVPEEAIVIEDKSIKTIDNVAHALNSLDEQNLPTDDFLTVSTGYHMDRITDIMEKFGLKSQPKTAEEALNQRAREHAEKMREKERAHGNLSEKEIEQNYQANISRYERIVQRLKRNNQQIVGEIKDEPLLIKTMKEMPGFWLPLALAVRGDKLKELVDTHRDDIEAWLGRHPDIGLTAEDLITTNFDYMDLVNKGREKP